MGRSRVAWNAQTSMISVGQRTNGAIYSGAAGEPECGVNRRNRRLFDTTNTELNAIAAPAIRGLSNPSAANGSAAMLYANAQNKLPLIVRRVARDNSIASPAARRSPRTL